MALPCKNNFSLSCWLYFLSLIQIVSQLTFIFITTYSEQANAYVRTRSNTGYPLYWTTPHIDFKANPTNSSRLSETTVSRLFRHSLNTWTATTAAISYSFTQSTANSTNADYDQTNRIFFSSNSSHRLSPGVIAVTQVTYYTNNGEAIEADLIFNDDNFVFTDNLGDTGQIAGSRRKIYLPDVAVHEFGHAFGLDHTNINLSSMIFTAFTGQSRLSDDDYTAINTVYPRSGLAATRGSISGTIEGLNGGIFGGHVSAINLKTGAIQAARLANADGSFTITDLPAGNYAVMAEAFRTSSSIISTYWQNINHRFCGGGYFKTTFYSDCSKTDGLATTINVSQGRSTNIGVVSPSCSAITNTNSIPNTPANARNVASNGGAHFGKIESGETHYYKLTGFSGDLKIHVSSYTLYSPVDVNVEILNTSFALVGSRKLNVEQPMPGGLINYDASATGTNLPYGDYYIRITSPTRLAMSRYPAGSSLRNSSGFYLASFLLNNQTGTAGYTDMSRCREVPNTSQSETVSKVYSYDSFGSIDQNGSSDAGGGCGTIQTDENTPFYNHSLFSIFAFMLLIRLFLSRRLATLYSKR